ncbi:MAG TPA: helix-hairpin-helix domain-containing protein [Woeseiaceae bacterium]|nr:helix-hairpin-helix domain-containing protein [Woeseiaceae bacterium]
MKDIKRGLLLPLGTLLFPLLALAGPVDINSADAETLSAELKGVGMAKAQAIVAYRKQHGPFKSVDDLALVKGIGARTLEINRKDILLRPSGGKSEQ